MTGSRDSNREHPEYIGAVLSTQQCAPRIIIIIIGCFTESNIFPFNTLKKSS